MLDDLSVKRMPLLGDISKGKKGVLESEKERLISCVSIL